MICFSIFSFIFFIPSINTLPILSINSTNYPRSDLLVHDFRQQFHPTYPYRCLLQIESKYFYLNPSCQLLTRVSLKQICSFNVTLKLELVWPKNTTVYQVIAQSNQTQCQSTHNCQFERNPYRIKLKENQIVQNFLQIQTIQTCSSTHYMLSSTNTKKNLEYFSLNSSTGYLSLLQPLDYESTTTWKLVIQAFDRNHIPFYTYVIIDVDDINDCPPLLTWNFPLQTIQTINDTDQFNMNISVYESKVEQKNTIIANLIASDLDSPLKFNLKLNSSKSLPFTIDGPYGDATYVLLTNAKLDREIQDQYDLHLILQDSGRPQLTSHYKLHLTLLDNNDNPPKFEKDLYRIDLQENNFVNTTLLQVFAHDADLDDNSRITYHLSDETNPLIWIDQQTGIIRTKLQLNFEDIQTFSFNITAIDHPKTDQSLNSTAMITVYIIDQNDNIPKFPYPAYEFSIYENNSPHIYIGQVLANDDDNSSLTYTFDNPSQDITRLFSISPSDGKIYAHQSFDREQIDHYIFYLIAFDGYHKSSRIEIRIRILDLNDEIPRFTFPNENNDTLILDRQYWNPNHFISQIEIHDNDLILTHKLLLIYFNDQLKNYDYLKRSFEQIKFDSDQFFLDEQGRLFHNRSTIDEGVYYIAFKVKIERMRKKNEIDFFVYLNLFLQLIDGDNYYDEKILKLIVVNDYQRVQIIMRKYDYLGLYLNNRFAHLQYQNSKTQQSSFDQSNKYLLLILFCILTIILIGITFLFISLIKRRDLAKVQLTNSSSTNNTLHVANCYDYNDLRTSTSIMNDNCSLLETIHEKEITNDQQQNTKVNQSTYTHEFSLYKIFAICRFIPHGFCHLRPHHFIRMISIPQNGHVSPSNPKLLLVRTMGFVVHRTYPIHHYQINLI